MTTNQTLQMDRRTRFVAALITTPAVLAALGVLAIDVWRFQSPNAALLTAPFAYSLADAIAADNVQEAYTFIRAGQDPNELIAVRHPVLTDGRPVLVSPLLWAVATQKRNVLLMLLGHGARMDRAMDRSAGCLADALGDANIASLLRAYEDAVPREGCQARNASAPLLSLIEKADSAK
jgi:hypothetical protein